MKKTKKTTKNTNLSTYKMKNIASNPTDGIYVTVYYEFR